MVPSLEGHSTVSWLPQLPAEVGSCPALLRLDVSSNRLLDLPASLTQLQKIQRIDAKSNFLTRVPPCLGHLRALKEFDLRWDGPGCCVGFALNIT